MRSLDITSDLVGAYGCLDARSLQRMYLPIKKELEVEDRSFSCSHFDRIIGLLLMRYDIIKCIDDAQICWEKSSRDLDKYVLQITNE